MESTYFKTVLKGVLENVDFARIWRFGKKYFAVLEKNAH
jgi:hypothetical protein